MLLKIKYYYDGTGYYDRHFKSVYRSSLISEYFIKLDPYYMRLYYKKARVFNQKYRRFLEKRTLNNQNYVKKYFRCIKRKNRGSKIKSHFFKKKIKKKKIIKDTRKKKPKVSKVSRKKKFKFKHFY